MKAAFFLFRSEIFSAPDRNNLFRRPRVWARAGQAPSCPEKWMIAESNNNRYFFSSRRLFFEIGIVFETSEICKTSVFYVERKWDQINVFRWRRWRRRQLRRNCDVIEISNDYETASDCGNSPRIWSVVGLRPELWRRHSEKSLSRGWLCSAVKTENLAQTM